MTARDIVFNTLFESTFFNEAREITNLIMNNEIKKCYNGKEVEYWYDIKKYYKILKDDELIKGLRLIGNINLLVINQEIENFYDIGFTKRMNDNDIVIAISPINIEYRLKKVEILTGRKKIDFVRKTIFEEVKHSIDYIRTNFKKNNYKVLRKNKKNIPKNVVMDYILDPEEIEARIAQLLNDSVEDHMKVRSIKDTSQLLYYMYGDEVPDIDKLYLQSKNNYKEWFSFNFLLKKIYGRLEKEIINEKLDRSIFGFLKNLRASLKES